MNARVPVQKKAHLRLIAFSVVVLGRYPLDRGSSLFNKLALGAAVKERLLVILALLAAGRAGWRNRKHYQLKYRRAWIRAIELDFLAKEKREQMGVPLETSMFRSRCVPITFLRDKQKTFIVMYR